jgi:Ca-activated chloride channel family protein
MLHHQNASKRLDLSLQSTHGVNHRSSSSAVVFLAIYACIAAVGDAPAQELARPTFRSRVAVVPITAVVRDSRNRVVRDLRQDEFEIREQGRLRPILDFSANADGAISVAVLFDTSGSMALASNLAKGKDVVSRLLGGLQAQRDEMALYTFHKTLREEVPFTDDRGRLQAALDGIKAWGMTSLYDAVGETARRLSSRSATRRAVIVISDGLDTSSTLSSRDAAMLASSIDVPVYVVAVVSPLDEPSITSTSVAPSSGGGLRELAEFTGGDAFHVTAPGMTHVTDTLLTTLRHQYLLAIESASEPGTYALQITTRRKGHQVRARRAYSTELSLATRQ